MARPKGKSKPGTNNKVCMVNGKRMTVAERDLLMKLEYINGGLTIAEVAQKYGQNVTSVYEVSRKNKWGQQKKDLENRIEQSANEQFVEVYAKCGVEINLMYNNIWQKIIKNTLQIKMEY